MNPLQLDFFHLVIIPILIILARVLDVSIGTLKIILISKGYRSLSSILGFFESFIWIVVVSQIMKSLDNYYYFAAYGAGFALGTYIGVSLERVISLGQVIIRVITRYPGEELAQYLLDNNYSVTKVNGEGRYGSVNILFLVVLRKQIDEVVDIIKEFNPKAFYTIEDVRSVSHLNLERPKSTIFDNLNIIKFLQRK
jgi:uncharacterized protein YebE (UPF0316 family)